MSSLVAVRSEIMTPTVGAHRSDHNRFSGDQTTSIGAPSLRVHDLRHTAAPIRLAQGADPKVVQRPGHATASMTMDDVYGHLVDVTLRMTRTLAEPRRPFAAHGAYSVALDHLETSVLHRRTCDEAHL